MSHACAAHGYDCAEGGWGAAGCRKHQSGMRPYGCSVHSPYFFGDDMTPWPPPPPPLSFHGWLPDLCIYMLHLHLVWPSDGGGGGGEHVTLTRTHCVALKNTISAKEVRLICVEIWLYQVVTAAVMSWINALLLYCQTQLLTQHFRGLLLIMSHITQIAVLLRSSSVLIFWRQYLWRDTVFPPPGCQENNRWCTVWNRLVYTVWNSFLSFSRWWFLFYWSLGRRTVNLWISFR